MSQSIRRPKYPQFSSICVVAMVLLVAGIAKLSVCMQDLVVLRFLEAGLIGRICLSALEIGVATVFLFNPNNRSAYKFAALVFAFFLCFDISEMLRGETTCGCFGKVSMRPTIIAAFNICVLCLLLSELSFGKWWNRESPIQVKKAIWSSLGQIAILSTLVVGWESSPNFRQLFETTPMMVCSSTVHKLSDTQSRIMCNVPIRNVGPNCVTLVGGDKRCGFKIVNSFPMIIAPGQLTSIDIETDKPTSGASQTLILEFDLYTEDGERLHYRTVSKSVNHSLPNALVSAVKLF